MTENNIFQTALKVFDKSKEKYDNLFEKVKFYKTSEIDNDLNKDQIKFYDKNNKLILTADYEVCSLFYKNSKMWLWAWCMVALTKNKIQTSKNLLNYGLDIDITKSDEIKSLAKYYLINSKLDINNPLEIDILLSLSLYLSKKDYLYQAVDDSNGFIQFLFLENIKKKN